MEITIVELRDFPSLDTSPPLGLETWVFYSVDAGPVQALNLRKQTTDVVEIQRILTREIPARSKIVGQKFEVR